jgi:hypothetical protein
VGSALCQKSPTGVDGELLEIFPPLNFFLLGLASRPSGLGACAMADSPGPRRNHYFVCWIAC